MYTGQKIKYKGLPGEIVSIEYLHDKITTITIKYEESGRTIQLSYDDYKKGIGK